MALKACSLILAAALAVAPAAGAQAQPDTAALGKELTELRGLVNQLQGRIDDLEARLRAAQAPQPAAQPPPGQPAPVAPVLPERTGAFLRSTSINFLVDTYYSYNINHPIGRANSLRAYDVTSNNFSLNQIGLVMESPPDPAKGKPFGARVDWQWGQATQTLQGNPANEARPEIYRALFQAYGTWIAPVGKGLQIDLGKWASSLGIEGNYTKDQINYSRSYWFNFLPFYHTGLRMNYPLSDRLGVSYWLVNGTQQAEAFNYFKDQLLGLTVKPASSVTWTLNYYLGQEHPDVVYFPNGGGSPDLPTLQGVPFQPIPNAPDGRIHIFDTYLTWQATPALTVALEGDDVTSRVFDNQHLSRDRGGAAYLRYQVTPKVAAAVRVESLDDTGALFSGVSQRLSEATFTGEYRLSDSFVARAEWRHDRSSRPFFLTEHLGALAGNQNTLTLGTVWTFGDKEGSW
jgi:Putative beta-barrel porin-2, OmpL-like. bbp2